MAISKSHRLGSISIRRSSCKVVPGRCCTGNRLPLALALLYVTLAAVSMLAPCSALPFESTTLPTDVEEIVNQNETTVAPAVQDVAIIDPVETKASEVVDELVDTSFVSLGGEDLEQDIRNAVKSEMELEMEADASSPVVPLNEEPAQGQTNETDHEDTEVQSVREPKTLEAEEEGPKAVPLNPQANNDQSQELQQTNTHTDTDTATATLVSNGEEEGTSRPLPSVTSDVVSVIFNENRAITEQPITKTNLLALEQEHEEFEERETTPLPIYEGPKHQVTKKQGVEDLLPIEVAPEVDAEPETPSQEIKTQREDRTLEEQKDSLNEIDTEEIEPKALSPVNVEPAHAEIETEAEVEARAEIAAKAEIEAQVEEAGPPEETIVEPAEPQNTVDETGLPETTEETATEVLSPEEEQSAEEVVVAQTEQIEIHSVNEPTQTHQLEDSDVNQDSHNVEDASSEEKEAESDETDAKTEQPKQDSDLSEEEKASAGDEPKSPSDDSTATPLVSYPPHNAGQTFDNNSADEQSAPLSRPSSYRSTMIIALCSGTAVIFIITSLVIFVVSFQRQHGTLDIEMQEQRLGKDSLDEEDAQLKLLDVDLSTPVIVSMGNEETDECL
ncbi:nuclear receptor corepressor 2 [Drosophila obscura]|uniref:nuclear receptor corepressor 2 n=1 Tax=Drosophila obscura TaxID=7282 RepID=UPI001BB0DBAE|nr:nuclear receptor corepressor 2 [Drosophila obscura]